MYAHVEKRLGKLIIMVDIWALFVLDHIMLIKQCLTFKFKFNLSLKN